MVFSSLLFSFIFLPIVLILYFVAKDEFRNYILLAASLLFYSYGEPKFIFVMIASISLNYVLAILISYKKSKVFLAIDIILNIGILYVFKYFDFSIMILNKVFKTDIQILNIALPIGISFFTFQALSYVIDVYQGTVKVQKNPLYLALYISFFPQLIAGPIVRYSSIEGQIADRQCSVNKFAEGARRFMLGFSKKVLLANNLGDLVTQIQALDISTANPIVLWLGALCYSLQIYYDFSGYSDMAIGLGKIFGFEFHENFNYPYISKSVTEFWRRWHISLSQWFRDYVYIPLGGSRVSVPRHIFNMFVVWMLTGIWHGANYTFIVWGAIYYIFLVIEKYIVKPEEREIIILRVIWQIVTLLVVNFAWVIFASDTIGQGINYCMAMLGKYNVKLSIDAKLIRYLREYGIFIISGVIFSTPICKILKNVNFSKIISPIAYGCIFLWAVSYIILGVHNPFIYFNF